jgi:cob(I)alamin adenosyltransferase
MFGKAIMGNRLSKIVTRTGDDGTTGLADGSRVSKDAARIQAMGTVDELNSQLGLLLCETLPLDLREMLLKIQNDLFDLGGALAHPSIPFSEDKLARLDAAVVHYNSDLPPLKEFILPGGTRSAAQCHVARTVTRRAERELVLLLHTETAPPNALPYLNRLSDLLFVLSRVINRGENKTETSWLK